MKINLYDDSVESFDDFFSNVRKESFLKPWMKDVSFNLLDTLDQIEEYFENAVNQTQYLGLDLETTSLDVRYAKIVGVSLSFAEKECAYIPIMHEYYDSNVDLKDVLKVISNYKDKIKYIFYNAKYDTEVLYYNGLNLVASEHYEDAMLCVCLYDSNSAGLNAGLKTASKRYLEREMVEFKDVTEEIKGQGVSFSEVEPRDACIYAGSDALNTRDLYLQLSPIVKEKQKFIYELETKLIDVVRRIERNGIKIDYDYFMTLDKRISSNIEDLENEILEDCKKVRGEVDLTSSDQMGKVFFEEMGIENDQKTATGKYKTNEEALSEIYKKTGDKVLKKYIDYKKLVKAKTTYITPFIKDPNLKVGHISLKQFTVATGRFAGGGGGKNSHYIPVNSQSIPSVSPKKQKNVKKITNSQITDKHYSYKYLLDGFEGLYCLAPSCDSCPFSNVCEREVIEEIELDVSPNIRRGFTARSENNVIFTIDFSGVELRMVTNLSKEPKWLDEFLNGSGDLHIVSAMDIYGLPRDKISKDQRGLGKTTNFLSLYGGSHYRLMMTVNTGRDDSNLMLEDEAKEILEKFWAGIPVIDKWRQGVWAKAEKLGYAQTAFGRIRPLPALRKNPNDYSSEEEKKRIKKERLAAHREAVSLEVQGSSADLMKISMLRCDKAISDNGWEGKVFILLTVHDELVFECERDIAQEVIKTMVKCMDVRRKDWEIPFVTDIEYSNHPISNWGMTKECRIFEDGNIYPTSVEKYAMKEGISPLEYINKNKINPLIGKKIFEIEEIKSDSEKIILKESSSDLNLMEEQEFKTNEEGLDMLSNEMPAESSLPKIKITTNDGKEINTIHCTNLKLTKQLAARISNIVEMTPGLDEIFLEFSDESRDLLFRIDKIKASKFKQLMEVFVLSS